ncbi:hypothetical protein ACJX0J_024853 [Zea mays]
MGQEKRISDQDAPNNDKSKKHKEWLDLGFLAWVNVSFLAPWAVDTILGATQKVDMRYTRRMGVIRVLVAVIDVGQIPDSTDIVVSEGFYDFFSKIERKIQSMANKIMDRAVATMCFRWDPEFLFLDASANMKNEEMVHAIQF